MMATYSAPPTFISHRSSYRFYGLCWGTQPNDLRIAVSTFIPGEYLNKLQVLRPTPDGELLVQAMEIDHPYPPTKVMWSPATSGGPTEYLATSADYLRLWKICDSSIERHATIARRTDETCAPLTSFDWNEAEPNIIGTSSTDTTCTIWDLNNITSPKQQIIAHDHEVYDMAFSTDPHVFGSVGGDGSLRIFDLRSLESSTIVYESPDLTPLLRIGWNKLDDRYIAAIACGSPSVLVLDLRNTTRPVVELNQHRASVNSLSWSPHSRVHLCTAGEDATAIVYDISATTAHAATEMSDRSDTSGGSIGGRIGGGSSDASGTIVFRAKAPINQIRWSATRPNCIALLDEDAAHIVQVG